jgi:hypothetical protein
MTLSSNKQDRTHQQAIFLNLFGANHNPLGRGEQHARIRTVPESEQSMVRIACDSRCQRVSQSTPDCFSKRLGLPHETFVINLHFGGEFITLRLTQLAGLLTVKQPPEPSTLRFVHSKINRSQQVAIGKLLDEVSRAAEKPTCA